MTVMRKVSGKPIAAIVPVDLAASRPPRAKPMSNERVKRSVRAFVEDFSAAEPQVSAVEDLMEGRR